jgi:hypothetical protein
MDSAVPEVITEPEVAQNRQSNRLPLSGHQALKQLLALITIKQVDAKFC